MSNVQRERLGFGWRKRKATENVLKESSLVLVAFVQEWKALIGGG